MSGAQIELLKLQSKRLQDSARELNEKVARIDQSIKNLVEALHIRLLDIYKYDARAELNLLLSTEDTHEAVIMSALPVQQRAYSVLAACLAIQNRFHAFFRLARHYERYYQPG